MTHEDDKAIQRILDKTIFENTAPELALGFARYEALRKLNPRQFAEIHQRNLNGERFDDMIDELVLNGRNP